MKEISGCPCAQRQEGHKEDMEERQRKSSENEGYVFANLTVLGVLQTQAHLETSPVQHLELAESIACLLYCSKGKRRFCVSNTTWFCAVHVPNRLPNKLERETEAHCKRCFGSDRGMWAQEPTPNWNVGKREWQ